MYRIAHKTSVQTRASLFRRVHAMVAPYDRHCIRVCCISKRSFIKMIYVCSCIFQLFFSLFSFVQFLFIHYVFFSVDLLFSGFLTYLILKLQNTKLVEQGNLFLTGLQYNHQFSNLKVTKNRQIKYYCNFTSCILYLVGCLNMSNTFF